MKRLVEPERTVLPANSGNRLIRRIIICQTYNRLGNNACTSHKIEARVLYNLVLKDIQELAKTALKDADAFISG